MTNSPLGPNVYRVKRIIVAGGTGFIGSQLVFALAERGDQVTVLTRNASKRYGLPEGVELREWQPDRDGDWQAVLDGKDAVVHLAGEGLVGKRYNAKLKQEFYTSRVTAAQCLVRGIERAVSRPQVFVCGSAIGYYGVDASSTPVDESAPPADDYWAELCVAWEGAALQAESLGVRVVRARTGIVLDAGGGALEQMALPFKMFAGGPIGSGQQVVSWIHMRDAVGIFVQCIDDATLSGAVNVTAPNPVSNEELSAAIGEALHRPSWLRVPGFALKVAFGEGAQPILGGQHVVPKAMLEHGYQFQFPKVGEAVRHALTQ